MLGGRPTPLPVAERFERGFMRIGYAPQVPSDRAYWQLDGILVDRPCWMEPPGPARSAGPSRSQLLQALAA